MPAGLTTATDFVIASTTAQLVREGAGRVRRETSAFVKLVLRNARESGCTQRNEACDVFPSQKTASSDARRSAVRSGAARSSDARSRAGSRLGVPARASTAHAAASPAAMREGARHRLVAPASAGRRGDGTSGRRERSASAFAQRHVCAGAAAIQVINPQTGWGGNVPSRLVGF
jgi:hypothetical protein